MDHQNNSSHTIVVVKHRWMGDRLEKEINYQIRERELFLIIILSYVFRNIIINNMYFSNKTGLISFINNLITSFSDLPSFRY